MQLFELNFLLVILRKDYVLQFDVVNVKDGYLVFIFFVECGSLVGFQYVWFNSKCILNFLLFGLVDEFFIYIVDIFVGMEFVIWLMEKKMDNVVGILIIFICFEGVKM